VHRVHELLPVGTIRRDFDLISDPWRETFQVKDGQRRWERDEPRRRSDATRWIRPNLQILDRARVRQAGDRSSAGGRSPHHRAIRRARGHSESRGINAGSRLRPQTDRLEFAVGVGPVGDDRLDST
jgi:hypothetical protein